MEVSVIMPVQNVDKHTYNALKSILDQSFVDYEVVLVNFAPAEDILSFVKILDDNRIRAIVRGDLQNRVDALNAGLSSTSGKYLAIMDTDHIMHVDRLKIQHAWMEAEPSITVCTSRVNQPGDQSQEKAFLPVGGLIENPILALLRGNFIIHPTAMIRKEFLTQHRLQYENYSGVEDFKLWAEIAKRGGQFYVDTQALLSCHSENIQEAEQKQRSSGNVVDEIVEFLASDLPELETILSNFKKLRDKEMMSQEDIVGFFQHFYGKKNDRPTPENTR